MGKTDAPPAEYETVIVVLDDEAHNLELVTRALTRYRVEAFTDPKRALARCEELSPALILTDYRMPHMNGVEFIQAARELGIDCPVVMTTAFGELDDVLQAKREHLVEAIVAKPWKPSALQRQVEHTLKLVSLRGAVRGMRGAVGS